MTAPSPLAERTSAADATVAVAPRSQARRDRLTWSGILLFLTCLAVAGSAFKATRVEVFGLLLHPYLFVMAPALVLCLPRLGAFPVGVFKGLAVFWAAFSLAAAFEPGGTGEALKVLTALLTTVAAALMVRSQRDFVAGAFGLVLAIGLLSITGLRGDPIPGEGINPMHEVANKNAFSLYSAPAFFLALFLLVMQKPSLKVRLVLAAASFLMVLVTFMSGNRSGWLSVFVAGGLVLARGRSIRSLLLLGLIAGASWFVLEKFLTTEYIEQRVEMTMDGYHSDDLRSELFAASVRIGLEHPLLGVSPQLLPLHLARHVKTHMDAIDPHNVFGYIIGGTGWLGALAFAYAGWQFWSVARTRRRTTENAAVADARWLMHGMLILWCVRGVFSREILVTPAFSLALGLCVGLASLALARTRAAAPSAKLAPSVMLEAREVRRAT